VTALEWRQAESLSPDESAAENVAWWRAEVLLGTAQETLRLALAVTAEPVPCQQPGPDLWLSDRRRDRKRGAKRCRVCPVLAECGALAAAMPFQRWGVFGGHDYAMDDDDDELSELRALSAAAVQGAAGDAARAERDALLVRLHKRGRSVAELAAASGLVKRHVQHLVLTAPAPRQQTDEGRQADNASHAAAKADRIARARAEVEPLRETDPRVRRLGELSALIKRGSRSPERDERGQLVAALWTEDPRFWTHVRLAVALGYSEPASAGLVLHQALRRGGADR
jgi:hypothetical protein